MAKEKKHLGVLFETAACLYLTLLGYEVTHRNLKYKFGEIDLVAKNRDEIIIVEVRSSQSKFLEPGQMISKIKLRRLRRLAMFWQTVHPMYNKQINLSLITFQQHSEREYTLTQFEHI